MFKPLSLRDLPAVFALAGAVALPFMKCADVKGAIVVLEQYRDVRTTSEKVQAEGVGDFDATLEQPLEGYVHQKSSFSASAIDGILELDSPDLQQGWSTFNAKFRIDRDDYYAWHYEVAGNALGPDSVTSASATLSSEQGVMSLAQSSSQIFYLERGDYSIQADASARLGSSRAEFFFRSAFPGDVNVDGRFSFADFASFKASFGQRGSGLPADLSRDGKVDLTDFGMLKFMFEPPIRGADPVPEPSTCLLAALAGIGLLTFRFGRAGSLRNSCRNG